MKVTFTFHYELTVETRYIRDPHIKTEHGEVKLTLEISPINYGFLETLQNKVEKLEIKFIAQNHGWIDSRLELFLVDINMGMEKVNMTLDKLWTMCQGDSVIYISKELGGGILTFFHASESETFTGLITVALQYHIRRLTSKSQAIILLGIKKRRVPALEWCGRFVIRDIAKAMIMTTKMTTKIATISVK